MAKNYHVTVKRDWTKGTQWGITDMGTDIITLNKKPFGTKKEAEDFRKVYNKKSQEYMQRKYGDGFYHGLAVVECEVHEPGEALVKWKDCGEVFNDELWQKLSKLPDGVDEKHVLLKVRTFERKNEFSKRQRVMLLSSFRNDSSKSGVTGTVDGHMYYEWFDCLLVDVYAEIIETESGQPEEKK